MKAKSDAETTADQQVKVAEDAMSKTKFKEVKGQFDGINAQVAQDNNETEQNDKNVTQLSQKKTLLNKEHEEAVSARKEAEKNTINAKKAKVRLFNAKGKYIKKYLNKTKKVRFDRKKFVKGSIFYHIKGTKYWVRLSNITSLKKHK